MSRRFTVAARRGNTPVMEVRYDNAGDALRSWRSALAGAGHDERKIQGSSERWTLSLMDGVNGFTVLDPDLHGSVSISIRTT